jgi:hypothetical protein
VSSAKLASETYILRELQPIIERQQFRVWASAHTNYGNALLFASVIAGLAVNFPAQVAFFIGALLVAVVVPHLLIWEPTLSEIIVFHEQIDKNYATLADPDMLRDRPSLKCPLATLEPGARRAFVKAAMVDAAKRK